ncbi:putative integron gene cassette protein [Tenacibaculum sp. 190130A14a]|uniref:Integron gene cassette protein n=1 Tax=Tenacibaculum polynesiense TaxID=3137857 RepID=A0ABM9P7B6_9FLAO
MDSYKIFWKNEYIGELTNIILDMSYWEGTWEPNSTDLAKKFTDLTSTFDTTSVMINPTKGIRAILEDQNSYQTHILIISLIENNILLVKRIIKDSAIEWLLKNVPEE